VLTCVCVCACAVVCAACGNFVLVQPCLLQSRCCGCAGHWCNPGPPAPAAHTGVRCELAERTGSCCGLAREFVPMVPSCLPWHAFAVVLLLCTWGCVVKLTMCSCSLQGNRISGSGATAICAGLVHLPQLQILAYVVSPGVQTGSWRGLARDEGQVLGCAQCFAVRPAFSQPQKHLYG
jgi:hypothetical protein